MNRILLVSGYLGAGKTSFIKNFIEDYEGTVALLINDFGKVNIDAQELEGKCNTIFELTNGSIFCSCLKDNFIESLAGLLEYGKDIILIEGSGLADPSNMKVVLSLLEVKSERPFSFLGSVCVLDGRHFLKEIAAMESVSRQVAHSQLALLNKIDLLDECAKDSVRMKAQTINPNLLIVESSYGKYPADRLLEILESQKTSDLPQESLNTPESKPMTLVADFVDIVDVFGLRLILTTMLPYTNRMKGFVKIAEQVYKVDSVQGDLEIKLEEKDSAGEENFVIFLKNGLASLRAIQKLQLREVRIQL